MEAVNALAVDSLLRAAEEVSSAARGSGDARVGRGGWGGRGGRGGRGGVGGVGWGVGGVGRLPWMKGRISEELEGCLVCWRGENTCVGLV